MSDDAIPPNSDLAGLFGLALGRAPMVHESPDGAPAPGDVPTNAEPSPGCRVGPYVLLDVLGEGGFGRVWKALQKYPVEREVALKLLKVGMDSAEVLARFDMERRTLAVMSHPNIAGMLDAGTSDSGQPYFVMELVEGLAITDYCDSRKLPIRSRLELMETVCRAVHYAHQKAILHRDIKPANLLVCEVDGKPFPRVIDFGIAKVLESAAGAGKDLSLLRTLDGFLVGTPAYMSPEQASGGEVDIDIRSDIYSLGAVLYQMLTGHPPRVPPATAGASDLLEFLQGVRSTEAPPLERGFSGQDRWTESAARLATEPRQLRRLVQSELNWIVLKALDRDRDRRYASAGEFADDLARYLRGEPLSAGPPSQAYRLRKWIGRHRGIAAAAGISLLSLVAGFGISVWMAVRATRAEQVAAKRLEQAVKARDAAENLITEAVRGMRHKLAPLGRGELLDEMVGAAERYFDQLPPELADAGTASHRGALALNKATLRLLTGGGPGRQAQIDEVMNLVRQMSAKRPSDSNLFQDHCIACLTWCYLSFELDDMSGVAEASRELIAICGSWLDNHPQDSAVLRFLPIAHSLAAISELRQGRNVLASMGHFKLAVDHTDALRIVGGETPDLWTSEGILAFARGRMAMAISNTSEAVSQYALAETAFGKVLDDGRTMFLPMVRDFRARALSAAADAWLRIADKDPQGEGLRMAEERILRAMSLRTELLHDEPRLADGWRRQSLDRQKLANIAAKRGDRARMLAELEAALNEHERSLQLQPDRLRIHSEYADLISRLGDEWTRNPQVDWRRVSETSLAALGAWSEFIRLLPSDGKTPKFSYHDPKISFLPEKHIGRLATAARFLDQEVARRQFELAVEILERIPSGGSVVDDPPKALELLRQEQARWEKQSSRSDKAEECRNRGGFHPEFGSQQVEDVRKPLKH